MSNQNKASLNQSPPRSNTQVFPEAKYTFCQDKRCSNDQCDTAKKSYKMFTCTLYHISMLLVPQIIKC